MTKKVLKMKLEKLPPKTFLMQLRRGRWKIENYGFKEQKSDVLNITNMYTKNCNGTKNIYLIIQFAHTILNLFNYGNVLIIGLNTTKKEVSDLIRQALTSTSLNHNLDCSIQLRLP